MKKALLTILLVLFMATSVFALEFNSNYYYQVDPQQVDYSLKEAFWLSPTLYSLDVLQLMQAYMAPEDALEFFLDAAEFTDDEIEEVFYYYLAIMNPQYAGMVPFSYMADPEAYAESISYVYDNSVFYSLDSDFTTAEDLALVFPRGIGRTDAYNTFRRSAFALAVYVSNYGATPEADFCYYYIDQLMQYLMSQYEAAMEAEAAAQAAAVAESDGQEVVTQ
ncbi:MAG: hypothetical protein HUK24_02385 [Sphaerochaetaceae bacterium]|nr:hypothetical protein [Sphaerochaetaceae bacterium]